MRIKKSIHKNMPGASANSLSKFIATAGIASRRKATEIIQAGNVTVNDERVTEPGYKLQPTDKVAVFGQVVKEQPKIYILLNKPKDYITTTADERGRKSVMDLIDRPLAGRVYPVGRLDRATSGLLLLTNDGELALKLSHPKYQVTKTYHVTLDSVLTLADFKKIQEGVELEDGKVIVDDLIYVPGERKNSIGIQLHSGKNRIVRRLFEHLGYQVKKLDRIGYSILTKSGLKLGAWRYLTPSEVAELKNNI